MSMETLEFVIYPDGRVQEKVTGITGRSCTEVTATIEAQLGRKVSQQFTSDYFSQATHSANAINPEIATVSQWEVA